MGLIRDELFVKLYRHLVALNLFKQGKGKKVLLDDGSVYLVTSYVGRGYLIRIKYI